MICFGHFLHGQDIDTICVEKEQFKNVLKWSYYGLECDSIVNEYRYKDTLRGEIIEAQHEQIILDQVVIEELQTQVKRCRVISFSLGGVAALLLILITVK